MTNEFSRTPGGGKRLVNFVIVLFVLTLGIGIGTLISYRVAATGPGDSQLKIQTDGKPVVGGAVLTLSQAFEEVAKRLEPAVVNVNTEQIVRRSTRRGQVPPDEEDPLDFFHRFIPQQPMPDQFKRASLGTGVIVDPKGYIVTNNHVIDGATKIKVRLKGAQEIQARVIGVDPLSDIAVIKIDGTTDFPYAKVGDSKVMKVGDWVLAIGSPFGLEQTVTAGIISTTGRVFDQESGASIEMLFNDYLQTDAAINRGNSGGPLVNMNAEVVGINTFIQSTSGSSAGVGFAVPSHTFVGVYNQIIDKGKMSRGWLGVNMNTLPFTPAMAKFFGVKQGSGVLITGLSDEKGENAATGPAAKAGIKAEDIITEIDGRKIYTVQDLRLAVANTPPGKRIKVKVVRQGAERDFDVVVAERTLESAAEERGSFSFEDKEEEPKPEIGLSFDDVPRRLADEIGQTGGALVLSVKGGSLAEEAGLVSQGQGATDIIVSANGKAVANAQDLLNLVKSLKPGEAVVLKFVRVQRGANNRLVTNTFFTSITKP